MPYKKTVSIGFAKFISFRIGPSYSITCWLVEFIPPFNSRSKFSKLIFWILCPSMPVMMEGNCCVKFRPFIFLKDTLEMLPMRGLRPGTVRFLSASNIKIAWPQFSMSQLLKY